VTVKEIQNYFTVFRINSRFQAKCQKIFSWFMVFIPTFNNISVIAVVSIIDGVPGQNDLPVASH
jgi:hypothetical protein